MSYTGTGELRVVTAGELVAEAADSLLPFPDPSVGDWFVLHTKSRQEKAIADTLAAMRIPHFLPLVRQPRYHGKRKAIVEMPLFPSYVFLRGQKEQAFAADRTKRIARIIPVIDQAGIDRELRNLHLALSGNADLDPYPFLKDGTWVEVRAGPFRGLQGVIDRHLKENRLVLQVNILGRATSLEIDASLLDPIEP